MDIAFKNPQLRNERAESDPQRAGSNLQQAENNPQRRDVPFSEIYELIFYNQSLVRSELEVLQLLIQNKLKQFAATEPNRDNENAHRAYKRQAVIGRILKSE